MQRIKPHGYRANLHGRGGMKIEHWEDRSKHPRRMYDWDNLLGVCSGEFQGAELVEHCDTKRKAEPLRVNPGTKEPPRPEDVFAFKSSPPGPPSSPARPGIWIHAIDPDAGNDIETLGLNADHLVQNRHSTIQQLRLSLGRRGKRGETAVGQLLRSRLIAATRPGPNGLPPFAPLVADYIRRKMRAKGIEP